MSIQVPVTKSDKKDEKYIHNFKIDPNENMFLQLPIYERIEILDNVADHNTFQTLINMPEFNFINHESRLQERIYLNRIKRNFSHALPFIENMTYREAYYRLVELEYQIQIVIITHRIYNLITKYIQDHKNFEVLILYSLFSKELEDSNSKLIRLSLIWNNIPILKILNPDETNISHSSLLEAVINGSIEALQWIKENTNITFDTDMADAAAENDELEILNWLYTLGIYPSKFAISHAAASNNINIIKWAISKFKLAPFENSYYIRDVANNEMYNLLKENDLLLPSAQELNDLVTSRNLSELINIYDKYRLLPDSYGANIAQKYGYNEILEWLAQHGIQPHLYNYLNYQDDDN